VADSFRIRRPTEGDVEAVTELVVDSWNRTAAKSVYERLGMRTERMHSRFEKKLRPAG